MSCAKELPTKMAADASLLVTVSTTVVHVWVASQRQMWGYQKAAALDTVGQLKCVRIQTAVS